MSKNNHFPELNDEALNLLSLYWGKVLNDKNMSSEDAQFVFTAIEHIINHNNPTAEQANKVLSLMKKHHPGIDLSQTSNERNAPCGPRARK